MTLAQLKQMLSKRMLIGQVQQREIGGRIDVTEAEERAYYDAHPAEFATTPSVTLREIQVNAEVDPVKKARKRRRARRGAREGRRHPRAHRQGRSVREGRGRGVGFAVEGQRRAHRPDLAR